ncbi:MAG: ABC transporter permease [Gammaproteobacteria bacterium]|nr:ABC transporter permease [Gammaproteobacteria bacterium]
MLELRPILSALWRHKVSALLIALQLGLTLAVISNAAVIVQERIQQVTRPTGVAVADIVTAHIAPVAKDYDLLQAFRLDLAMIRALPEVVAATVSRAPLTGSGSSSGVQAEPNREVGATPAAIFMVDEHFIDALGMQLVAGRTFAAEEIGEASETTSWRSNTVIITQQLADKFFANTQALGKAIYFSGEDNPMEVVGIVARNLGPWPNSTRAGNAIFLPILMDTQKHDFIVRAAPGQRDGLVKLLEEKLAERDSERVITVKTLEEQKNRYYAGDNTLITMLSGVVGLLTFIVALGIIGLTVFWVAQRQKQIGVRRALGANRSTICRYFLLENLMIATTGISFGVAAAQIFNHFLVSAFNQPPLPPATVASCALALVLISLVAALIPSLRAANISPATVTRSL